MNLLVGLSSHYDTAFCGGIIKGLFLGGFLMAESSESYGKELAKDIGKTAARSVTQAVVGSAVVGLIGLVLTGGNPAGAVAGAKMEVLGHWGWIRRSGGFSS
ncbi:MAG: hypothetical protein U7126_11550 [Microcoleus sp.]